MAVHGDRYSYDISTLGESKVKIPITCNKHGVFWQQLRRHLNGQGCPTCAKIERGLRYRLNDAEFERRARKVHGDRYDYSKVKYTLSENTVEIVCPEHGSFFQTANRHLGGSICPKCAAANRVLVNKYTQEEFVTKANAVHNNKYSYDQVVYESTTSKVSIGCPVHGLFDQTAGAHLSGQGCPDCGGRKQSNTEEFVKKAKAVHGDRYDYSKVDYVKAIKPVVITCRIHGDFPQSPNNHLNGAGCPKCTAMAIPDTETFVRRAQRKHGDRYDYSKTSYTGAHNRVTIGCHIHGDYEQVAADHLRGAGCHKCGIIEGAKKKSYTTEEFKQRARAVHGDRFDYSKSVYVDDKTPLTIICPKHGEFLQRPAAHIRSNGCRVCSASKGELLIAETLVAEGIKYIHEYRLPGTKYKYRYDFYIPEYNLLIEYHGVQHYKHTAFFGDKQSFRAILERDALKQSLALSMKYNFVAINYQRFIELPRAEFVSRLLEILRRAKAKVARSNASNPTMGSSIPIGTV